MKLGFAIYLGLLIFLALPRNSIAGPSSVKSEKFRPVEDALGAKVKVVDNPQRIVCLTPALAELVAALDPAGVDKLVGVSEYSDFPEQLKGKASIGSYTKVNLEKILSLKPDLVLASTDGNDKDQVLHLRELGLPVVVIATDSFAGIEGSMRLVGIAMGIPQSGAKMADEFRAGLTELQQRHRDRKGPTVMLQLDQNPLIVVGRGSFLNDAIVSLGAINIYGNQAGSHYPKPSIEDVLTKNPERIVVLSSPDRPEVFGPMAERWLEFKKLSAAKNKAIRIVDGTTLTRPTLRLLEGLRFLESAIYPE